MSFCGAFLLRTELARGDQEADGLVVTDDRLQRRPSFLVPPSANSCFSDAERTRNQGVGHEFFIRGQQPLERHGLGKLTRPSVHNLGHRFAHIPT